ncbi:MAG: response regulator [Leptospirales bacterium]
MKDGKSMILIVDDTPKNIQVLATILNENGYGVKAATGGKEALDMVDKSPVDLILLDIMMPEMDGFEVCTTLKKNEKTKDIPVIFLTQKLKLMILYADSNLARLIMSPSHLTLPSFWQELIRT